MKDAPVVLKIRMNDRLERCRKALLELLARRASEMSPDDAAVIERVTVTIEAVLDMARKL